MKKYSVLILAAGLFLGSCTDQKGDVMPSDSQPGTLNLHFDSRRSLTEDFVPNKMYMNANGDSVSIAKFKYYISNIELIKADGGTYAEPDSYHLIQAGATSENEEFELKNIPAGTYSKIRFHVGVDAAHNSSTATQVGGLNADADMTWDWNTGYMFLVTGGKYVDPAAAAANRYKDFLYTIGKDKSYRTVELAFPAASPTVAINATHAPEMHLHANIFDIFGGPNTVNVKANPYLSGDAPEALRIADNYATMFRIDHIHTL